MLTLIVSHNITLSRDERYRLHAGEAVATVGVSVPVWFDRGNTSEPAQEIFVKYKLTNQLDDFPVKTVRDGYEINMPQYDAELEDQLKNVDPETLRALGIQKELPTAKNLLDVRDGGAQFLQFRQFTKTTLVADGVNTKTPPSITHSVEPRTVEELKETLS